MQPASTAGALARGLGLDPSAAPVEVLLNPLKTAVGSIGGTAAWESASATAGTRARSPTATGPARRAQGRLPGPRTPVAALTPKRACGGALLPIQHDCSRCHVCKACSLRVRGMPPAARASMGAYPASSP